MGKTIKRNKRRNPKKSAPSKNISQDTVPTENTAISPDTQEMIQPYILLGTPAYGSMVHTDYLHSVIDFIKAGLQIGTFTIGNESLITRGRNTIISYFHEHPEFTHLFYIDADIGITAESLIKMISHQKDVIGAPVPLKGRHPRTGEKVYNIGDILSVSRTNPDLVTTNRLGTAVFLLSRTAVSTLIEGADQYGSSDITRGVVLDQTMYDVFQVGVVDGIYLSEDYHVCHQLMEKGIDIWVDKSIAVRHNGNVNF